MNPSLPRAALPVAVKAAGAWEAITHPLYWWYERRLLAMVKGGRLPKHIGLIMDGNRRFARTTGLQIAQGHSYGAGKARELLDWCLELGVTHVTLWGFSIDNKGRDPAEVTHLHNLFASEAKDLIGDNRLHRNKVRVRVIGNIDDFPTGVQAALRELERATETYSAMQVNIALGYGGREEIAEAVRRLILEKAASGATLETLAASLGTEEIERHLYTAGSPDPDFVIRTSGEVRLSGFLLWQTAYSEFYFCDAFWPAFRKIDFLRAIRSFQMRDRRFGR